MAVRFIIGRAGSGKTHHCLEAVRHRIRQNPIDGPRLVMLVPEQAALQTERAIIAPADIAGAHRAEVLSFQRLAYRVMEATGVGPRRALSDRSRAMVLRHLLERLSPELRYYRRVDRLPGFLEQLGTTMCELIQEAIDPTEFLATTETLGASADARNAKFHDIALIYRAYRDFLGDDLFDPSLSLQLARERLSHCEWLHGAEVWVDGFASLMRQESLTLLELARHASHVDITLLMDPALAETGPDSSGVSQLASLFDRTGKTFLKLKKIFSEGGIEIEQPLILDPIEQPRFAKSPVLSALERKLFEPATQDVSGELENAPTIGGLEFAALPTRRVEVEYAASRIARWVRESGYRYRDLAIMVRDLEPYHDLLSAALHAQRIPFFIDRRRPTTHHSLIELLRSLIALAAEDFSLASVRLALKTGLLGLTTDESDELENYLLAHAISGFEKWTAGDWTKTQTSILPERRDRREADESPMLARVNATRTRLVEALQPWMKVACARSMMTGPEWIQEVTNFLQRQSVAQQLEQWAIDAEGQGNVDEAAEHRQVWIDTTKFLDELAFAFAETRLALSEWGAIVEAGLSKFTLGLTPPTLDQLLVGSIDRSRHPEIKAAVLLGFNDGVIPRSSSEDAIFNDVDRQRLESAGVELGPTTQNRAREEAMLLYIAVTRASESLVITRAMKDDAGKELRPSPFCKTIQSALAGFEIRDSNDVSEVDPLWRVSNWKDLARELALEFGKREWSREQGKSLGSHDRTMWTSIYNEFRNELFADAELANQMRGLIEQGTARLSNESIQRLHTSTMKASVSQLETFATCPFKQFAKYTLGLKERELARMEPRSLGSFQHAVLEEFVHSLAKSGRAIGALENDELKKRLAASCDAVEQRLAEDGITASRRSRYLLQQAAADVARVARFQRMISRAGQFRPGRVELPFGYDVQDSLPPLELSTPKGRNVVLRGFVDRVDWTEDGEEALAIVLDYKRTKDKKLDLGEVFHGISLQLLGYMLVITQHGAALTGRKTSPAAALYVSLAREYDKQSTKKADDPENRERGGTSKPRGLILVDAVTSLASDASKLSVLFNIALRKKDGAISRIDSSDGADRETLQALMEMTRRKLGELADGVLDGHIAINPYRLKESPCTHCEMKSVCRFELGLCGVRWLDRLGRKDVMERALGRSLAAEVSE